MYLLTAFSFKGEWEFKWSGQNLSLPFCDLWEKGGFFPLSPRTTICFTFPQRGGIRGREIFSACNFFLGSVGCGGQFYALWWLKKQGASKKATDTAHTLYYHNLCSPFYLVKNINNFWSPCPRHSCCARGDLFLSPSSKSSSSKLSKVYEWTERYDSAVFF